MFSPLQGEVELFKLSGRRTQAEGLTIDDFGLFVIYKICAHYEKMSYVPKRPITILWTILIFISGTYLYCRDESTLSGPWILDDKVGFLVHVFHYYFLKASGGN
jgi:hypothetical protein